MNEKANYRAASGLWRFTAQAAELETFQVTIGAATTQVSATTVNCTWVSIQNNATHTIRVGDSTVTSSKGIQLFVNGSFFIPPLAQSGQITNLSSCGARSQARRTTSLT